MFYDIILWFKFKIAWFKIDREMAKFEKAIKQVKKNESEKIGKNA